MTYYEYIMLLTPDELAYFLSEFVVAQLTDCEKSQRNIKRFRKDINKFLRSKVDDDIYYIKSMLF